MRVEIKLSDRHDKRYVAVFYDKDKKNSSFLVHQDIHII